MPTIKLLVPDLPCPESIAPFLARMHERHWYTNFGPLVQELESKVRNLIPCVAPSGAQVLATASGTLALELAVRLLGLPVGRRVLLPSLNFPAAAHVLVNAGLVPLFTDVDAHSGVLTPDIARQILTHVSAAAVVPVAAFGQPLPSESWDQFYETTGVPVIIDAAPALGHHVVGRHVTVVFSLHATKPFGIGEGGLLASANDGFIQRGRQACNFGYRNARVTGIGLNAKMSEVHAAVGLAQYERWSWLQSERSRLWSTYMDQLGHIEGICPPKGFDKGNQAVLQLRLPCAARPVAKDLAYAGIETRQWYCPPLHQQPAFADVQRINPQGTRDLTITDELARVSLGLPFHTRLSPADIARVCDALDQAVRRELAGSASQPYPKLNAT